MSMRLEETAKTLATEIYNDSIGRDIPNALMIDTALDYLKEAEKRGMERAVKIVRDCVSVSDRLQASGVIKSIEKEMSEL